MAAEIATTKNQREIMAHAINAELRREDQNRRRPRYKSDEYRNYYCASVGAPDYLEIEKLVSSGLMRWGQLINDGQHRYGYVTEAGIAEVM